MKISNFFTLFLLIFIMSCSTVTKTTNTVYESISESGQSTETEIDQRVKAILAKMTIEDKVGEMTQLSIDAISVGRPYRLEEPQSLSPEKLKKVLLEYRVGSILNCSGHGYDLEYWHEVIKTIQDIAVNEKETGIPVLYGIDAIHGTNYTLNSTLYPQQIAQAATWNLSMTEEIGAATAYETRATWIPWTFSPVLDIGRDPRWPRLWETFGEDVYLATEMGKAIINGYEGRNNNIADQERIASCMKHFLGYSTPGSGKDRTPSYIAERQLREYHVPTFKAAIEAGAQTIMINSGEINGIPVHMSYDILTKLLRDELGFEGFVVSDWEDIGKLVDNHKVAKDYYEATKLAVNAGIDMAMVPMTFEFSDALLQLVKDGEVSMSRIDEAVGRILKVKINLGLFENPYPKDRAYPDFNSDKFEQLSYKAAQEAMTLLKNENDILPLDKKQRVLVVGPTGNNMMDLNGGWTRTWQGDTPDWNAAPEKQTIYEAIQQKVGADNANYIKGAEFDRVEDLDKAIEAARTADVIVACLGEHPYTEKPGDIESLDLPPAQIELVQKLAATNKPVILVLVEGRPRIIRDAELHAEGVLMAYLPGDEGGRAVADVLFGDHNPAGKLPYTYPRYANDLVNYDHKHTEALSKDYGAGAFNPQYHFGFGLSYTKFKYSNLTLNTSEWDGVSPLEVSVVVTNTGNRSGQEVVQVYVSDLIASITPSVKRLRAFKKVDIAEGKAQKITFKIPLRSLSFVGKDYKWITEPGAFKLQIGDLESTFEYTGEVMEFLDK